MTDQTNWKQHWEDKRTPWDLGKPHAATRYLVGQCKDKLNISFEDKEVVIPGAGRAHDARVFLERKAKVTAVDLSEIACDEAIKLYGRFDEFSALPGDIHEFSKENRCDIVFDRAMLCALPDVSRKEYLKSMTSLIRQGGLFISVTFRSFNQDIEGPPFVVSEKEMSDLFSNDFDLVIVEKSKFDSGVDLICGEQLYVYRKK
jgi:thiopurine S-methyltransferase